MPRFSDRVALVTGAGGGIGRATESNALSMEPIGRIAAPEEIATTVLFLCSNDASFMTGHCMAVDGGMLAQAGIYPPAPAS